jgi:hypothetical protein
VWSSSIGLQLTQNRAGIWEVIALYESKVAFLPSTYLECLGGGLETLRRSCGNEKSRGAIVEPME